MIDHRTHPAAWLVALVLPVVLSACGGGSSEGDMSLPPPGALDSSFGIGGTVIAPNASIARGIALQPDGKIVVAAGNRVIRYHPTGALDAAFGSGGFVGGELATGNFASSRVVLQSDGKIVVAGGFSVAGSGGAYHCALVRYMTDGVIDAGFGTAGLVVWDAGGNVSDCTDVVVQFDGRIILAVHVGTVPLLGGVIVRFEAGGTPDRSFGADGVVPASGSLVVQRDGKILAAWPLLGHGLRQCELARVDAAGAFDLAFGNDGRAEWHGPFDDESPTACALALQADGKIVIVSFGSVARFLENGTLDPAFGVGGIVTAIPGIALAPQSNGKIVVAGGAGNTSPPKGFALWRLGIDGRLDSGFGSDGVVTTPLLDIGGAETVAIQSDGRIVAAGWTESAVPPGGVPAASNAALARYFGD